MDKGLSRFIKPLSLLCFCLGCIPTEPATPPSPPAQAQPGVDFEATQTGEIVGTVQWVGPLPKTPPLSTRINFTGILNDLVDQSASNPHLPRVNAENRGVHEAVVYLHRVEPTRCKAWSHPEVTVEMRNDLHWHVLQGEHTGRVGFARVGGTFSFVSRHEPFHGLRATGAAFFTHALPTADKVHQRPLTKTGRAELRDSAGYYWARAHLFVSEHPYLTRTDAQGRFVLDQVPPGEYELVAWLPSWHCESKTFNPDSQLINNYDYQAPVEKRARITVTAKQAAQADFAYAERDFAKQK